MMGPAKTRRAEEFDALASGRAPRTGDPRYDDLLEVVASLRSVPDVTARPAFVADLRTQLIAAAERQDVRVVDDATALRLTPTQRRGARERRLAAVVGGFAVVAATGSMAMAAQSALPGEVLYPVKRAMENAQTNLASSDSAKAESLLKHADIRLSEVEALAAKQDADADAISATLDDFKQQTNQAATLALDEYDAGEDAGLSDLREFNKDSIERLSELNQRVPDDSRAALSGAAENLSQLEQEAAGQCPECGGATPFSMPDFDPAAFAEMLDFDLSKLSRIAGQEGAEDTAGQHRFKVRASEATISAEPTTPRKGSGAAADPSKSATAAPTPSGAATGIPGVDDLIDAGKATAEDATTPGGTSPGSLLPGGKDRSTSLSKALQALAESLGLDQTGYGGPSSEGGRSGFLGLLGLNR
ncbi:hypothetical protein E8D34_01795 [Nocardioides sp. GY 10113]|uniref:DUF5667 domain-containing protein n=1 Tax=Nocardioides sp. GY 10113 TaxID=2569761 RepID=UPI0010A90562|nr:DUF5667 domain-containing protein [Nocardioides sp. GY 10113]TIC89246.1 hypothetical protein E8D34_01795 [Nocardioides sp. GY 10113]